MRAFQRYHQVTRRFADIAYNSGVFQDGTEAVGRGPFVGGHLLGAQNRQSWGTIAAIGKTETPSAMLLDALCRDYRSACEWAGREDNP